MNKTERMLAIVLELQRRSWIRAEDLAATFEMSVRTIYRDMQALSEAGVPLLGSPGQGYSLSEGYFLPPIHFTAEEAVTLLLGTDFVEQQFGQHYRHNAESARRKIESILPERVREQSDPIREGIRLLAQRQTLYTVDDRQYVEPIGQAIVQKRKLQFGYSKPHQQSITRTVCPYGLALNMNHWVLVAYCELRQDIRHFRLSRLSDLVELDEHFVMPEDFKLAEYRPPDHRHMVIRLQFESHMTERIQEVGHFYMETIEPQEQYTIVTMRVRHFEDVLYWILSWGDSVTVLEPESLRQHMIEKINNMLKRY